MRKIAYVILLLVLISIVLFFSFKFPSKESLFSVENNFIYKYNTGVMTLKGDVDYYPNLLIDPNEMDEYASYRISNPVNERFIAQNGTYNFKIKVDDSSKVYSIFFRNIPNASKIYINGDLVRLNGVVSIDENEFEMLNVPFVVSGVANNNNELEVTVQASNCLERSSGVYESVYFGDSESIYEFKMLETSYDIMQFIILGIFGIVIIIVFAYNSINKKLLYIGIFTLGLAIRASLVNQRIAYDFLNGYTNVPASQIGNLIYRFEFFTLYFLVPIFGLITYYLFPKLQHAFFKYFMFIMIGVSLVVTFILPQKSILIMLNSYQNFILIIAVYALMISIYGIYKKQQYARLSLFFFILILFAVFAEVQTDQFNRAGTTVVTLSVLINIIYFAKLYTTKLHESSKFQKISKTDDLTGLINRRELFEIIERETALSIRNNLPFTIALLDIDLFKNINDTFGHIIGDKTLSELSLFLKNSVRKTDIVGRYAGDEFIILFNNSNLRNSTLLMNKILIKLKDEDTENLQRISLSVGVHEYKGESVENFIQIADKNMYKAKNQGGNQIVDI